MQHKHSVHPCVMPKHIELVLQSSAPKREHSCTCGVKTHNSLPRRGTAESPKGSTGAALFLSQILCNLIHRSCPVVAFAGVLTPFRTLLAARRTTQTVCSAEAQVTGRKTLCHSRRFRWPFCPSSWQHTSARCQSLSGVPHQQQQVVSMFCYEAAVQHGDYGLCKPRDQSLHSHFEFSHRARTDAQATTPSEARYESLQRTCMT